MEFKYRKDTRKKYIINGEFKFAVNNKEVLIDYKLNNSTTSGSDWIVHKYPIKEPGMYSFSWIYTKYSEKGVTEWMTAELEVRLFDYKNVFSYIVH